ncbi:von Willebrand factor type A domain-containing protein [Haloferula sp. BvORR071]|uniref:YfbK domain-containing protein n=1 Tax=Haloferula sp. BvORR071 TaxID=1396141 RepID=UPI00054D3016|nr:von Willebrand factor type A domain-containing protein [Haloferula sp. BvORR071]
MNDHSNSLPPAGDDALQARIVAWVLGEASPFEAAELEKLCAENPRLRDFERRTRDLHELLAADAKPGLHPSWQLPPEKRGKITDLLGADVPVIHTAYSSEKVNRYFSRRILLAAAACLALSIVTFPVFMSRMESKAPAPSAASPAKLKRVVYSEQASEDSVDFTPSSGGGGGVGSADGFSERQARRRSLADGNLRRMAAEGATSSYAIPDSAPLPELAAEDGLSDGLGGRAGGAGNGQHGAGASPAKPASRPAAALAASPEQEKLRKQLGELRDEETAVAQNQPVVGERLGLAENAPAAPATPPPAVMTAPAVSTATAKAEAELPSLGSSVASGGAAGGLGARTAGGFGGGGADASIGAPADAAKDAKSSIAAIERKGARGEAAQSPNNGDFISGAAGGGPAGPGGQPKEIVRYKIDAADAELNNPVPGAVPAPPGGPAMAGQPAADAANKLAAVDDIVTGGLRSGDGVVTRNNIDAILENPNRPAITGAWKSWGSNPAEPGAKGDVKLSTAEDKPLDAASLAKSPAAEGKKDYFFRETAQPQPEAKVDTDARYKDEDLAWSDPDTADGTQGRLPDRGRGVVPAKEVAEAAAATKKSQAAAGSLSFSDDFGAAADGGKSGEKGMKPGLATPMGEPALPGAARGDLMGDLSTLSPQRGFAFQDNSSLFDGSSANGYMTPPIEDPRLRPEGGMPTDQDRDYSTAHFGLLDGRTIQMNGSVTLNEDAFLSRAGSLSDLQGLGQTQLGGELHYDSGLRLGAERGGLDAHKFSLDSLAALEADGKRRDATPNYYATPGYYSELGSGAPAGDRFAWSMGGAATGKPISGTTAWFDGDTPAGASANETMFGRLVQPEGAAAPATPGLPAEQAEQGDNGGYSSLASKEMIRRQSTVAEADRLLQEGREAYAHQKYEEAFGKFKEAAQSLPEAPATADRRRVITQHLGDAGTALADAYRRHGKYPEARQIADDVLAADADNVDATKVKEWLDDPIRTNPAVADAHTENVDKVRRGLYMGEGAYNLGKFDDANRHYEDVIRTDPYNKAARRGLERVAQARADYYRAAYDQTRAELLAQVDKSWELSVPPAAAPVDKELQESKAGVADGEETRAKAVQLAEGEQALARDAAAKAKEIVIPEFKVEQANLGDVLDTLRRKAVESDAAAPAAQKGLSLAIRKDKDGLDVEGLQVPPMDLKNASVSEVLEKITETTGLDLETKGQFLTLKAGPRTKGKQAEQIVDKMAEVPTATEPFSTFSLHVSDASFKLAKAALDRGEQPAAESIRPEEFYNAFDYGDPAPANGEPVVCVTEQCAHPAIPQRNLMRIAVRTAAAGRGSSTPLNLTLLLDNSGSMERQDRQAAMTKAVAQLAGLLKEGDTITVAGFARQPRLLADRLPGARAQELNGIIARTPSEGGTNLEEGIKLAEELAKRQFNPAAQNRIVLFTDGAANLGDARPEALKARVEQLRQQGIAFDAAGFGADGLNDRLLEQLTRNGNGRYYIVDRAEDAGTGFAKQLAGAFRPAAENVKVQVRFNPARVARYKLIGFEEHRLNKEDFRNDAVDAAEMAAEEAGVALYQIEPLPGGEGELGEVSVRFRDAASGQMVERTWTMPYEPQASAFDQAPPSIQLAGMAAFAAEKLRKAPLSDALDFKQLGKVFPGVKAKYPDSQHVSDLGAMIEKLK